ncbi:MAG: hypothetical protein Q8J78_07970 [Moraxellaceae bacterium]|nr:hypothetical protein [Moraxellaceae bacterium]
MQALLKFLEWENEITTHLEHGLKVCRSDAQGIQDAQRLLVTRASQSGQTARKTADQIIQHNTTEASRHD